ncbi:MAG TPA: hypothetical protein VNZ52_13960 [Candidatus Thermoplasmatota archaeon]|nr:hypothetical protein [Candidatus Thermoplasmatota archaeon]
MAPVALAAVSDLFFATKIRTTANLSGINLGIVTSAKELVERVAREQPTVVVVDLNEQRFDPFEAIRLLRAAPWGLSVPVVGFFSHVQVELKTKAEAAGATRVLPRSAFVERLPDILNGQL